jgi:threonine synthase
VNSIIWGRIMMQKVHYFYGYFRVVDTIGEPINMSVPSGGFGNLCAGGLARKMGLPIKHLIAANNKNACLHRIFSKGIMSKVDIHNTLSSAIDILIPYNFLRYMYFAGIDTAKIKSIVEDFKTKGEIQFDPKTFKLISEGFKSNSASDTDTLNIIKVLFHTENYLLDPHGAVALVAADANEATLENLKLICLTTAHPAKFPEVIKQSLGRNDLPFQARHHSIEKAKTKCEKVYLCDHLHLEEGLIDIMEKDWDLNH